MVDKGEQIEALVAIAEHVVNKQVLDKKELKQIEDRIDQVMTTLGQTKKFFKRLIK